MTYNEFRNQLETEGLGILRFWMEEVVDTGAERIYGQVHNNNSKDPDAPLSGVLVTRLVWTFSRAWIRYKNNAFLEYAEFCHNYLMDNFWDHIHGGIYWEVLPDGEVSDTRKQVYVQAFCIYALSEFYNATQFDGALDKAIQLYDLIETHALDRENTGYIEGCRRNWTPAQDLVLSNKEEGSQKTMNTHLHLMEASANLLSVTDRKNILPDRRADLTDTTLRLVDTLIDRIYDKEKGHLDLYFTEDWHVTHREYSPGHDIEAAWLLNETIDICIHAGLPDTDPRIQRVHHAAKALVDSTLATGIRKNGSLIPEYPAEKEHTDYKETTATSEWWPQAEAWTGFLDTYLHTREKKYYHAALAAYTWGVQNLKDPLRGEWYSGHNPDGTLSERGKAGFWKCPYHTWRACDEGTKRLDALL